MYSSAGDEAAAHRDVLSEKMVQSDAASLTDLPLEVLALLLDLIDYRSLASFEIAMPSSANILRRSKKKRLRIEIRRPDLYINEQFAVGYHRAVACLEWIKRRTQLGTLHVTYTSEALRNYACQLYNEKLNSVNLIQYEKIINIFDVWSKDADHFIADTSLTYFPDQIGLFTCVPESTGTDSMTINYRPASKMHVCYLPAHCENDRLFALPEYSVLNSQSTFDLIGPTDYAVIKSLLQFRKPKQLRLLGHICRSVLDIFYPEVGPVAKSVEKIVMYMPHGYELYNWDRDATGLHTWFPSLKECTLIDPMFPRDVQHIWCIVTKFLDANRPLRLKLTSLTCSRMPEQPTFCLPMTRSLGALTLGTGIASAETEKRNEIVFKRIESTNDAAAATVRVTFH